MKATYRKCSNLSLKSNPYVGWFRHSPPLTSHHHSTSLQSTEFTSSHHYHQHHENKSSPYIGWFCHAPSTCCKATDTTLLKSTLTQGHFAEYLKLELPAILQSIPSLERHTGLYRLEDLLCSGHLYGGSPQLFLKNNERSSLSGKILNVLACWLFQDDDIVLHHSKIWEAALEGNSNKKGRERFSLAETEIHDDSASSSSSSSTSSSSSIPSMAVSVDEFDACSVRLQRHSSSQSCSSAMLSSQAEAYYVHNAVAGSRSDNAGNDSTGFGRLDYDISQMDIVRMARSASRHLDVESILRLPTITYQSRLTATRIPEEMPSDNEDDHSDSTGKPEEWSWMLVQEGGYGSKEVQHKDKENRTRRSCQANKSGLPDYAEDDICVICLEQFMDGDRLRVLPCSHSFHVGCIDQWLSGSHSFDDCFTTGCPTCKKDACQDGEDSSDSMVPSWAFTRIGDALARQDLSQHAE